MHLNLYSFEGQGGVRREVERRADWGKGIWRGQREWHLVLAAQWLGKLLKVFLLQNLETATCLSRRSFIQMMKLISCSVVSVLVLF